MFKKISYKNLIALPLYILPLALITGPLIPEILIVLLTFIFIFNGKTTAIKIYINFSYFFHKCFIFNFNIKLYILRQK